MRDSKSLDSNLGQRSVVMVSREPNVDTQFAMNAFATVSADVFLIGIAVGQRVKRSMQVRMWV